MGSKAITSTDVVNAYRLILGRQPESSDVVSRHLTAHNTLNELRDTFLNSPEFRNKVRAPDLRQLIEEEYLRKKAQVEVAVTNANIADDLMNRVIKQWSLLGDTDPYWSVISDDDFRTSNLDTTRVEKFYQTGTSSAKLIDVFESRTQSLIPTGVCFELGCGVGRITHVLSQRFEKVIAVDISSGNLSLCEKYLQQKKIGNVQTFLMKSPADIPRQQIDFFFSLIVLQHNPPPIQKTLLDSCLSQIRSGGFCLFQTPDNFKNSTNSDYSFSSARYLREPAAEMDMHCLPKSEVLEILVANHMTLLDIAPDNWTGQFGSYTYFARKR